jgi:hypothetical protein
MLEMCINNATLHSYVSRDGSVGIATRFGMNGPRIESRWVSKLSARTLTGLGAPHGLLHRRYQVFPGGKAAHPIQRRG